MKEAESEIPEYMHQAAYQGNTLGLPLFCDHHSIANVTRSVIDEFINVFYQPSRMICVGVGVEHGKLERIATEAFGDLKNDEQFVNIQREEARYTGGQLKSKYAFDNNEDTHISLIFETEHWKSPDLMALCVLNMIMGGGGSFSAGGPGKGMYTRLYRDVLGTYHWINHISCSHSIFDDSGIFALYGCTAPESAEELTTVMVREAINMLARPPSDKEKSGETGAGFQYLLRVRESADCVRGHCPPGPGVRIAQNAGNVEGGDHECGQRGHIESGAQTAAVQPHAAGHGAGRVEGAAAGRDQNGH